jgi:hypothetical protein
MPIVGSFAGASARAYGLGAGVGINYSFDSIATVTVGSGGTQQIDFTSIPQTYTHLQVRCFGARAAASFYMYFNGDTTNANYRRHILVGAGASASSNSVAAPELDNGGFSSTTIPGAWIIDILDYTNTNKNKTSRILHGYDFNGSGRTGLTSTAWFNSAAITSIKFDLETTSLFSEYSSFALYGVKA